MPEAAAGASVVSAAVGALEGDSVVVTGAGVTGGATVIPG